MVNPIDWGTSLLSSTNPCLTDFSLFEKEITRMYGDRDWRLKAVAKASVEHIQGQAPAESSETVREYANRIRTNWREAGWDEAKFEPMLYDLAWAGIRYNIQSRIKPLANEETGRFDSLDQLFDKAAAAETIYPPKQPQQQQQQQNQNQGKGRGKRGQDTNQTPNPTQKNPQNLGSNQSSNSRQNQNANQSQNQTQNQGQASNLPRAPWISQEELVKRRDATGEVYSLQQWRSLFEKVSYLQPRKTT